MNSLPNFTLSVVFALAVLGTISSPPVSAQDKAAPVAETSTQEKSSESPKHTENLPEPTAEDKAAAEALLQAARAAVTKHPALQAEIRQVIMQGDRKLTAEGTYAANGLKLRLEYSIRIGTMQGKLVEVCDGRILHTERTILPSNSTDLKEANQSFSRRDVEKILGAAAQSQNLPAAGLAAELGIGGLPALMASIDRSMTGTRVTDEEWDGQACQVFHGIWDPIVMSNYDKAIGSYKATLAPFQPDHIQLYLSKDGDLPLQIVYLKNELDSSNRVIGRKALMRLEFRNYKFEPPAEDLFRFQLPSGREEVDQTEDFIRLLKQSEAAFKGENVQPAASK